MKSYTTIVLLALQLGSTKAASSSRRRVSYATNLDYPEAGAFVYGEYGDNDEYGGVRGATLRTDTKTKSYKAKATKAPKKGKMEGKGYFGKDCPMSGKGEKSKSGSKGKSPKSGEPTMMPSEFPSAGPSHSGSPSAEPTISSQPSWPWCQESEEPTISAEPSISSMPSPSANGTPGGGGAEGRTVLCENRGALYDGNTINIVDVVRGSEAVAGVASEDFGTTVEASETDKYNVDIVFAVTDGSVDKIGAQLDATVSPPTSLALVDCQTEATAVAVAHFNANSARRLEKDGDLAVIKNWSCVDSK